MSREALDRPPPFVPGEVVRVARDTGNALDELDDPLDLAPLIGENVIVWGAGPTDDETGWVIRAEVPSRFDGLEAICEFPEASLESVGLIEVNVDGVRRRLPLTSRAGGPRATTFWSS